ncbi:MFS transporter [Cellulomonas soli]|uniref:MFS transporter n=1 Tax=Cellulomonas soli TaxID=931535 RepID=UPI003F834251
MVHNVNSTAPPPSRPTTRSQPSAIVTVLAFAGITAAVMQTLVVPLIAELPDLLHTSASNASWIITATLLTAGVATPVSGRLGDLYGKRRLMLVCSSLLVVGSLICALATSVLPMIIGRGLQGAGMGLIPLGISAMRDILPPERLGSSIAVMSASMGVGAALGLPIAAAVAQNASWRSLFWGATALAVLVTVLIAVMLPASPGVAHGRFDYVGALGLSVALVCLLLGVSKGADWGWGSVTTIGLLASAVVVAFVWGWYELRASDPLVDLRVTARPVVLLTNLTSLVVGFAMYAQSLILPQLLQLPESTGYGLGQNMIQMGLWLAPGGLMMLAISPLGARLSHARGPKVSLALGSAVVAVGYIVAIVFLGTAWGLAAASIVCSTGVALAYGAIPALIMGSVPRAETGSANSFNTLMRSIGTSVSAAVVGLVLSQMTIDLGGGHLVPSKSGFVVGLVIGASTAVLAAVVASTIPGRASLEAEEHLEHGEEAEAAPHYAGAH